MADEPDTGKGDDILEEAKEAFAICEEREAENRKEALDDLKFARLDEQWPEEIRKQRDKDGRPCLTFPLLAAYIRQISNDARQNKPAIKVHPSDSLADVHTAEVLNALLRQISNGSQASIAYDTAIDFAISMGFGYFRINTYYAEDDTFDLDICVDQIANPFSVWADPYSTKADSSDWNTAFVSDLLSKKEFERKYPGADAIDWKDLGAIDSNWREGDQVRVAEYWTREEIMRTILLLSNQEIVAADVYELRRAEFDAAGLTVAADRQVRSHKVRQQIISGAEVLEDRPWPGKYIPIVPVYGEEVNVEGKRVLRSLIRGMKDAQRKFNFDKTASAEFLALAPKAPFIGVAGAFTDPNWADVNSATLATLEVDPEAWIKMGGPPQRQPFDGSAAAAMLQQALSSADDMRAISGIHEAAQGATSNEISGVAIGRRIAESDTSNFHFMDNLNRAIEHGGRIQLDLIPYVYSGERIIRVLGQDNSRLPPVQLGSRKLPDGSIAPPPGPMQPQQPQNPLQGSAEGLGGQPVAQAIAPIYDLTVGKYDVVVDTGPSFTTRRQEAASMMAELAQAFAAADPQLAAVIIRRLAKLLDWPDADQLAQDLQGQDPKVMELQGKLQAGAQAMQSLQDQLRAATQGLGDMQVKLDQSKLNQALEEAKLAIQRYDAETSRFKAVYPKGAAPDPQTVLAAAQSLLTGTDPDPGMATHPMAVGLDGQSLQQAA